MMKPVLLATLSLALSISAAADAPPKDIYAHENLMAWCIVPFDAAKRGPEERAAMLEKLGIRKFVYDYRAEHVPTFDAEMEALKRHHIELTGWWFPGTLNADAKLILDVIKRHGMTKCDLWVMGGGAPTKSPEEQAARVKQEAARIKPIADEAAKLGVRVGLYNHGSWFGEPENMVAIAEELKREGAGNVGIVYNLHHGHEHLDRFPAALKLMLPHLICVNLNGMTRGGDAKGEKILPLGQGDLELGLLRTIRESGYRGPIGILNHTGEDAEQRLRDNLEGLQWLVKQLNGLPAGPKPTPKSWHPDAAKSSGKATQSMSGPTPVASLSPEFGKALAGGMEVPGRAEYHTLPLTVECRAKLAGSKGYNILVACDPKPSADHWELYTHAGGGQLALYLPGRGGDYRTTVNVCDGKWHRFAAVIESERVQLFIDGERVLDKPAPERKGEPKPGGLAFGQLAGGGLGCDGVIDDVRLSRGARAVAASLEKPLEKDAETLGLWSFDDLSEPVKPAAFEYDFAPLHPEQWPHKGAPINQHRLYDFYAKEAIHFMKQQPVPALLPEYPGLEGGTFGHWGTQNDQTTWKDGRWNDTDLGNMMSGVFRGGGKTIVKGVSVRLGEHGELSACFDPLTLGFPVVWKNGFVGFSDARHGFMNGTMMKGEVLRKDAVSGTEANAVYHGFYRHGQRVIFSYAIEGKEYLDAPWAKDAAFVSDRQVADQHPLRELCKGGPAQWPQWIETEGVLGSAKPYALDTLTLPVKNPWKTFFFVSGSDFFSNGDAAICTMTGEVWLCRGIDATLRRLRWKRFATGLHQPLGLRIFGDKIYVQGRDQITRLHDLNGDDEADFYECVSNVQTTSPGGHDYITGLERDGEGRFYIASGNQGVCRITPPDKLEVLATGFRNPNGLGLGPDGSITTSVQEGDWTPASAICQIKTGGFYGHGGPKDGRPVDLPLIQLPRGLDNSCGGQCFTESDRWGPLGGQLIHFSPGAANHFLILREKIGDTWQAAALQLPGDFRSGAQQGRIHPKDGQLYVTGMFGWGTYAPDDGCFQRVRYTGGAAHYPVAFEMHNNGVLLTFSDELQTSTAADRTKHFAQSWNYFYSRAYGSPEFSVRHPSVHGHDVETITSAHVIDGKKLFLEIPQLHPADTIHLHLTPAEHQERDLFITARKLADDFTRFPGYRPHEKETLASAAEAASMSIPPPAKPNPWAVGKPGRAMKLEAALGLQYLQRELKAKPGERLSLTFKNPDVVPHNFVLVRPGKLQAVGDLANKLIADPAGLARHYVPDSPDVMVYTDMTNTGASFTIHFEAPKEKGDYPYLCTFPGHWMVMNGVLKVE